MNRQRYFDFLKKWKDSPRRKPLLLEGARQVGKTWLMREFAKLNYEKVVYIRFDKDRQLRTIFERDLNVERILHELEISFQVKIEPENTVIIFDEIQACKDALTSMKYFCEDRPDIHLMAAGSLLGLEYRDDEVKRASSGTSTESTGFPVGKVTTLAVHPLSFLEFVEAMGYEQLVESVRQKDWRIVEDFREVLINLLKHYYVIGGMPEAVTTYLQTKNFLDVRQVHQDILIGYQTDFAKHAPKRDVWRIESIWHSLPEQLAKENRKFLYSLIKTGERAASLREPIAWLVDAGLIHLCPRISTPKLPLLAYAGSAFKAYALDVGLLSAMSGLDDRVVLEGSRIFMEFKGALTEQYVLQELLAAHAIKPCYWSTEDSRTEIDFVIQQRMDVIPIEVKAGENVRSKSLQTYLKRFTPPIAYRFSMLPYRVQEVTSDQTPSAQLINIPLYAIGAPFEA